MIETLHPPGWPRPSGYAHGMLASPGRLVFVAGQIGWDASGRIVGATLAEQVEQALRNTVEVLKEAGAGPEHVTRMTWYVTDRGAYLGSLKEIGEAYRSVMGRHFPAMSVVVVAGLLEPSALVEIESTAVVPSGVDP